MEKPVKKRKRSLPPRNILVLSVLGAAFILGIVLLLVPSLFGTKVPEVETTYRVLSSHKTEEVTHVTVTRRDGTGYALGAKDGKLYVPEKPDFVMDETLEQDVLTAAAIVAIEDTVYEAKEEWEKNRSDFGLGPAALTVDVGYKDGKAVTYFIGGKAPDSNLYYFELAGDPGLYLAPGDLINLFGEDVTYLHKVSQPIVHYQRIDKITIQNGDGEITAAWALETAITAENALSAWRMTAPYSYPCDEQAMKTLLTAMGKLYLGRFVTTATEEAKAQYGFSPAQRVITLHQAAGKMATINNSGAYTVTDYPETTLTLAVGNSAGDYVDYCMLDGSIYLVSSLSQPLLNKLVPESTLLMQPAAIAMDDIASLTVEKDTEKFTYTLRRQERVLPNNELATDEAGNVIMDTFVEKDGQTADFAAFDAALTSLQTVTVSGRLPGGFVPAQVPNLRLVFTLVDGRTRTLECVEFDSLQDALSVDGVFLHYLPKGLLDKGL